MFVICCACVFAVWAIETRRLAMDAWAVDPTTNVRQGHTSAAALRLSVIGLPARLVFHKQDFGVNEMALAAVVWGTLLFAIVCAVNAIYGFVASHSRTRSRITLAFLLQYATCCISVGAIAFALLSLANHRFQVATPASLEQNYWMNVILGFREFFLPSGVAQQQGMIVSGALSAQFSTQDWIISSMFWGGFLFFFARFLPFALATGIRALNTSND
jgi:hypothetical protein